MGLEGLSPRAVALTGRGKSRRYDGHVQRHVQLQAVTYTPLPLLTVTEWSQSAQSRLEAAAIVSYHQCAPLVKASLRKADETREQLVAQRP